MEDYDRYSMKPKNLYLPNSFPIGSRFFGLDVIVSSVVLWTFVLVEGRRADMKRLWAPLAAKLFLSSSH
jgi:hypothetical protein